MSDSATPWTAARQASLSFTISWSLLKFMSIELVMASNHLVPCRPLLLLPSVFPSMRVTFSPYDFMNLWIECAGSNSCVDWSISSLRKASAGPGPGAFGSWSAVGLCWACRSPNVCVWRREWREGTEGLPWQVKL